MDIQENPRLLQNYRMAAMIAAGLAVGILVYAAVVEFMLWSQPGFAGFIDGNMPAWLRPLLIALAVVLVLSSGWVRGHLLGDGAGLDVMVGQALLPQQRYQVMLRAVIVALVMCEAAALCGLLLFMLSGMRLDFYGLALVALFGMRVRFPAYQQWQMWYARRNSIR